jgi:hypothetical protein
MTSGIDFKVFIKSLPSTLLLFNFFYVGFQNPIDYYALPAFKALNIFLKAESCLSGRNMNLGRNIVQQKSLEMASDAHQG